MAFTKTKKAAEVKAKRLAKKKGIQSRVDDRQKPLMQPGGKGKRLPPKLPKGGKGVGKWRNRRKPRGQKARDILKKIRSKRTQSEIRTALQLAKDDDMSETEFINFVMSLDLTGSEAYTFWFSPP